MRHPRFFLNTILGVVIGAAACSGGGVPTGPEEQLSLARVSETQLKGEEKSENRRIAAAQNASKATYDALKLQWQRFLDSKPVQGATSLLMCDPLQYTAQVKVIGKDGGDVDFGPHKLRIPAGALSQPTVITAEALTSLNVAVTFSPHGLRFLRAPRLELSYKHCYLPRDFHDHSVVYLNDLGRIVERPASRDYKEYDYVTASILHFSRYAVAY